MLDPAGADRYRDLHPSWSLDHLMRRTPMRTFPRRALAAVPALALVLALGAFLAPGAGASYGPAAAYQTALSFNCTNPSLCGPSLGGFWGWVVFNADGSADAQLVGCSHFQGGSPAAGAQSLAVDVAGPSGWYIAPPPSLGGLPGFWLTNETDTFNGRSGGPPQTVTIPSENIDLGIPAIPGHYSAQALFGLSAPPGTNFEIQVTAIPDR
ncbi:MAG: hypothetical protein ACTHNK_00400 [Thermomicrobiales bacterium]